MRYLITLLLLIGIAQAQPLTYYGMMGNSGLVTNGLILNLNATNTGSYSGSGSTWYDLSGLGNNGTLYNSPSYSSLGGGSLVFGGTSTTNVQVPSFNSDSAKSLSVFVWVYQTNLSSFRFILTKRDNSSNDQYEIYTDNNQMSVILFNGGIIASANAITPHNTNTWYYFGFTKSGTNGSLLNVYDNGIFKQSANLTADRKTSSYNLMLGNSQWGVGTYPLLGNISQVQIYNRVLTASEISKNFNSTKKYYGY